MKQIALVLIALIVGLLIGWNFGPGPMRYFITTKDIEIVAKNGDSLVLPAGTPMASDAPLLDSVDLGWWGFVPVYFHTAHVAVELGIEHSEYPKSIAQFTLDGSGGEFGLTPAPEDGDLDSQ